VCAAAGAPKRALPASNPHHFTLTDEDMRDYDSNYKMNPPLRSKSDWKPFGCARRRHGRCIATDHAPHAAHEKNGIRARGVRHHGIGTALGLAITRCIARSTSAGAHRGTVHCRSGAVFDFAGVVRWCADRLQTLLFSIRRRKWTFEAAKSRQNRKTRRSMVGR